MRTGSARIDYDKLTGALLEHARSEEENEAAGDDPVHRWLPPRERSWTPSLMSRCRTLL